MLYVSISPENCLISSFYYIKPQRFGRCIYHWQHCLISSFYIKPQLKVEHIKSLVIVLYRLSTSNHNL